LEEVRNKIEARYAKAKGVAELQGNSVESHMLEIETAQMDTAAKARLDEIRTKLGISTSAPAEQQQQVEGGGS
jgi:phage shock protein A